MNCCHDIHKCLKYKRARFANIQTRVVDQALCFFQPILSNSAQTGHLSLNEMRDAAVTLLRQCGAARSEGGLAINIGKAFKQARRAQTPKEHGLIVTKVETVISPWSWAFIDRRCYVEGCFHQVSPVETLFVECQPRQLRRFSVQRAIPLPASMSRTLWALVCL